MSTSEIAAPPEAPAKSEESPPPVPTLSVQLNEEASGYVRLSLARVWRGSPPEVVDPTLAELERFCRQVRRRGADDDTLVLCVAVESRVVAFCASVPAQLLGDGGEVA